MFRIKQKTANGIYNFEGETELLDLRKIFIEGQITNEVAMDFMKKVMVLSKENKPIDVYINSYGGDVNAGLFIYDVIQTSDIPINLYCCGIAYSMAAIIFASGKHNRYMLPHSRLMLHEPLIENASYVNASSIKDLSDSLQNVKKLLVDIISERTGKDADEIDKILKSDCYFDAKASLEFGLCDSIVDFKQYIEKGEKQ